MGGEEVGDGEGDSVAVVDAGDEVGAVLGHGDSVEGEVFVFEAGFQSGVDCTVVSGLGVGDHADLLAVFRGMQCWSCLPPAHHVGRAAEDLGQTRHENIRIRQQIDIDKCPQGLIAGHNKPILIRQSSDS